MKLRFVLIGCTGGWAKCATVAAFVAEIGDIQDLFLLRDFECTALDNPDFIFYKHRFFNRIRNNFGSPGDIGKIRTNCCTDTAKFVALQTTFAFFAYQILGQSLTE